MMIGKNVNSIAVLDKISSLCGTNGKDIRMAELGVWKGESSVLFEEKVSFLFLVDSWSVESYYPTGSKTNEHGTYKDYIARYSKMVGSTNPNDFQKYYDSVYKKVLLRFKGNDKVSIHRMTTDKFYEWFKKTKQRKLDCVYLDASHDYSQVMNDLDKCFSVLLNKRKGILLGDDYGNKEGVTKAVDEFTKKNSDLYVFDNFYKNQFMMIPNKR